MLQQLVINNYAIIERVSIEPDAGLNTVTGETGAGKSIILGALSLILGERADTSVLINKEEKSVIEGHFFVKGNEPLARALAEEELEQDDVCIIRREISASGKSRAFVNDTPVTLQVVNKLTSMLVDLQQQFGHLAIAEDSFQVNALDAVATNIKAAEIYREKYKTYKRCQKELEEKQAQLARLKQEADYKQYLLDELVQASFKDNEIEEAEQQLKQMAHSERILSVLQGAYGVLNEGEQPLVNELKRVMQQLQSLADVLPAVKDTCARMSSVWIELKDIVAEIEDMQGSVQLDPAKMEELQQRNDLGYKLLKKHGMATTSDLLSLQQRLEEELMVAHDLDKGITELESETARQHAEVMAAAGQLSDVRKKAAPDFVSRINELLALVGMPNARFGIEINEAPLSLHGMDNVQFVLDANKSGKFQLLYKAASGGEMSRIMLCIKSLIARALHLPTLIFDEVDTGISGEAARQVGILLRELSGYHQVICITHQPQVAARGTRHFFVYKEADTSGRLSTKVKVLAENERVRAIAQMIGGEQPSDAALASARELVVG
ncbi:MAG: DNA repair protein RecN [Chitinophagaceae bacterium]|nr:DNA repair protein RecN [Chitinophagaceae bacterium]